MIIMDKNTLIRKISPGVIFKLSQMLDDGGWKEIMAIIPSDLMGMASTPKYTVEQIRLIEAFGAKHSRSCTEVLLDEWGTSGKVQPTIENLLHCLIQAELFRAADYLAVDVLKDSVPQRPTFGPAAPANVNLEQIAAPLINPITATEITAELPHLPYSLLEEITNYFDETPMHTHSIGLTSSTGHKIGAGAFGAVYYGVMPDGRKVAVKRLMSDAASLFQQFKAEITTLSVYRHPNLLPLLGYSCDTVNYCLIYEFMQNYSLQDRLAVSDQALVLNWRQRLDIAIGVCRGIHYLHTARSVPLIHRDVKTANILLDGVLEPRLGDFGLVKVSPTDSRMTSTVFGTSAYMAPEAFRGDVSVKTDVFSFGVVLLELLTGLSPYDTSREGADLITHVESIIDDGSINMLLDPKACWELKIAENIYAISQQCLEDKRKRPIIADVLNDLNRTSENVSEV